MRCLVMSSGLDAISELATALGEKGVMCESSTALGAGLDLVRVSLLEYDFGIAVIPTNSTENQAGRSAILLETGVAAAKRLPIFAITSPGEPPISSLGSVMSLRANYSDTEAIRFHLDLFLSRVLREQKEVRAVRLEVDPPTQIEMGRSEHIWREFNFLHASRRTRPHRMPLDIRESAVEEALAEELARHGAVVRQSGSMGRGDVDVDIAFVHPGIRETILVELKPYAPRVSTIESGRKQLAKYIQNSSNSIGLLLYGFSDERVPSVNSSSPRIYAMALEEFLSGIEVIGLEQLLMQIRNRMVHGQ